MTDRYYLNLAEDGRVLMRYDTVINGEDVPEGATPVTRRIFSQTLSGGKGTAYLTEAGKVEFRVIDLLSPEDRAASDERAWRDAEVESVKWLRERHRDEVDLGLDTTLTLDHFKELLSYLQALRDWPQSSDFPTLKYRPVRPDWLAEQT